jgi:hypothetical protein
MNNLLNPIISRPKQLQFLAEGKAEKSSHHSALELPINKLSLRKNKHLGKKKRRLQKQKRISLYPTMMDMDNEQHHQNTEQASTSKTNAAAQKFTPKWQKHRRPMLWGGLGIRQAEMATSGRQSQIGIRKNANGIGIGDDGKEEEARIRESIQTCLFLRTGCAKIHRTRPNQLASFVQNLDVQERITNGFVLSRKSKKKTRHPRRLL